MWTFSEKVHDIHSRYLLWRNNRVWLRENVTLPLHMKELCYNGLNFNIQHSTCGWSILTTDSLFSENNRDTALFTDSLNFHPTWSIFKTILNIIILFPKVLRGPIIRDLHSKHRTFRSQFVVVRETREYQQRWSLTNLQYFLIFHFRAIQKLIGISLGLEVCKLILQ